MCEHSPLDRYIRGDDVSQAQLEQVWKTTTQAANGLGDDPIYAEFFAAVRDVQRRGGRAIKNGPVQKRRGRGGRFGEIFRPKHFAELTTPSAALRWLRDF
jgi:hypothetical protein